MRNYVLVAVITFGTSCGLVVGNYIGYAHAKQQTKLTSAQTHLLSPTLYYLFTQLLHTQKLFFQSVKSQLSLLSTAPTIKTTNLLKEI